MAKTRLVRWGDAIPIVFCFLLACVLLIGQLPADAGAVVRVQTSEETIVLPLQIDAQQTVVGMNGHSLILKIEDGRVCVQQADCPDQVCVNTGWLSRDRQTAACLPAGILLTVQAVRADNTPDAVAR